MREINFNAFIEADEKQLPTEPCRQTKNRERKTEFPESPHT
jgi:hypothetical protein